MTCSIAEDWDQSTNIDLDLTRHQSSSNVLICYSSLPKASSFPPQVLLLDEITVDLDVLARADLLTFLVSECAERGATIIYATHIFDGLDKWATHIVSALFPSVA